MDAQHGGHSVRVRLLCDCIPQTVIPRHPAVRDQGDDTEDQAAADGTGHLDTGRARGGTTAGERKQPACV